MKKAIILLSTCLLLSATKTIAQSGNGPCGCNLALKDTLRDEITSTLKIDLDSSLSIIFSKSFTYWENGDWVNDKSMQSGGQAYASLFSGFLNGSQNEEKKRQIFQEDSSTFNMQKKLSFSQYQYLSQKTVSAVAYNAWSNCKELCFKSKGDAVILKRSGQIPGQVTISLTCSSIHTYTPIKIVGIEHPNVTIVSGNLTKGDHIKWGQPSAGTFRLIHPNEDGIIQIQLENNWEVDTVIIPGIHYTIGTLVSSDTSIEISNGKININSKFATNEDVPPSDPVNQWVDVPMTDNSRNYAYGKLISSATVEHRVNGSTYDWSLKVGNELFVTTGLNGTGSSSINIFPEYNTDINLPVIGNYSKLSYSINLSLSSTADRFINFNPADSQLFMCSVNVYGNGLDTTIKVLYNSDQPKRITIDAIRPGHYDLILNGYREMLSIGRTLPSQPPPVDKETSSMKVDVTVIKNGIIIPPTNYKWIMYSLAALLILVVIVFLAKRFSR